MRMKVKQLASNQFIIYSDNGDIYLQSYNVIIAKQTKDNKIILDEYYWDYSKTTGKYRNIFLGEDKRATEIKTKTGEYKLANLN